MDDQILISRFQETEDRAAFEEIINRYEDRVFRFGFRMCGQEQDAEDVVQDTFVSAFRYLKGFRGEASLLTWLLKIASV
jgi:RNA polymerase sigma-70 factor (ECF subfamily)